ncbi:MAG: ABC transporter permease [bacterium]|nr:ABC transporter permease [bacterium]
MQRLLFALLTVWLALTASFFLLRLIPGDALSAQLDLGGASRAEIAQARADMGLDDPPIAQYIRYMSGVVRGDFGYSLIRLFPVSDLIAQRFAPTALLALFAMSLAVIWGVGTGILATLNGFWGIMGRGMMTLSLATPLYWTGTLAIIAFSAYLPYSGVDEWQAWILPILVLAFHSMGGIARVAFANIQAVKSLSFVIVARSKGLHPRTIMRRHILRVALLPVLPIISTQFGFLLGGAVITETLFVRVGIGRLLLDSVIAQDYPVVQGIVALSAMIVAFLSLITDYCAYLADPRLRWMDNNTP